MTLNIHPREAWENPKLPVDGPAPKGTPGTWVVHYPWSRVAPATFIQIIAFLRAIQADYERRRGYSIGYSFGVSQAGSAWDIRGDDFNNAANAGKKVPGNFNHVSRSILVMVADAGPASPKAVATVNALIATEPTWNVIIHGDVDYTPCCGVGIIHQVRTGIIGQQDGPPPPPPPPPPPVAGYSPPDDWGLYPLDMGKPTQRHGSTGGKTRYIQDVIYFYAGGNITRDGDFGSQTATRVRDVQSLFGFPDTYVDGVVGWDGGDGNNPGPWSTWTVLDYLVALHVPPPVVPPVVPPTGMVLPCKWYINSGDSPWSVGSIIYGSGKKGAQLLDASSFGSYSVPGHAVFCDTPGVTGKQAVVESGDGALSVLRRMGYENPYDVLDLFYAWNGDWERVLLKDDLVHMPI